ncbi:hypothetical protein VTN77DRAFT_1821 [Rasamsonia byssochlamydoides]|uniref:uncharacterized protein n=1 Tax=Rasamsonia byssochlamydoides TaxID=89139 RepID=UPI0037448CF8
MDGLPLRNSPPITSRPHRLFLLKWKVLKAVTTYGAFALRQTRIQNADDIIRKRCAGMTYQAARGDREMQSEANVNHDSNFPVKFDKILSCHGLVFTRVSYVHLSQHLCWVRTVRSRANRFCHLWWSLFPHSSYGVLRMMEYRCICVGNLET